MNVIIKYLKKSFNFLVILIFDSIQHDASMQKTTPLLRNTTFDEQRNFSFLSAWSQLDNFSFRFLKSSNWALRSLARRSCGHCVARWASSCVARWAPRGIATANRGKPDFCTYQLLFSNVCMIRCCARWSPSRCSSCSILCWSGTGSQFPCSVPTIFLLVTAFSRVLHHRFFVQSLHHQLSTMTLRSCLCCLIYLRLRHRYHFSSVWAMWHLWRHPSRISTQ